MMLIKQRLKAKELLAKYGDKKTAIIQATQIYYLCSAKDRFFWQGVLSELGEKL